MYTILMSYVGNVLKATDENSFFRKVIFTGAKSQLVVMDIKPGEDIGEEVHEHVEQWLFIHSGHMKAMVGGREFEVTAGDVVIVAPNTRHNFTNVGKESVKIYTVYVPANHIDGRVHKTKADAIADTEDETFGERVS